MTSIQTLDLHTAGEPLRIIRNIPEVAGKDVLDVPGDSILAKRRWAQTHLETMRCQLMLEPRGHADMYGAILTPPVTPDGDVGVLFLHNEGFSTMCGHGIIGIVKAGLDRRLYQPADISDIRIDTPAGRVVAAAHFQGDKVATVSFRNVPSFMLADRLKVDLGDGLVINAALAFGGAFYAYVDSSEVGLSLQPDQYPSIVSWGKRIKQAFMQQHSIQHPAGEQDLNFLYGTIFVEPVAGQPYPQISRNVCVFAEGEVDRSPTGTGVSGRAAIHHARGDIDLGETISIQSIVDSAFSVRCLSEADINGVTGIVPEVSGQAFITGEHHFLLDQSDIFLNGFLLR